MGIFDSLRLYADKWSVSNSRNFTAEEIDAVERATVVASAYGNSVCFFMKAGGQAYIPLSTNSTKGVGEAIDLKDCKLLTLSRQGDADINRIEA